MVGGTEPLPTYVYARVKDLSERESSQHCFIQPVVAWLRKGKLVELSVIRSCSRVKDL